VLVDGGPWYSKALHRLGVPWMGTDDVREADLLGSIKIAGQFILCARRIKEDGYARNIFERARQDRGEAAKLVYRKAFEDKPERVGIQAAAAAYDIGHLLLPMGALVNDVIEATVVGPLAR
jgi:hypothetical protein